MHFIEVYLQNNQLTQQTCNLKNLNDYSHFIRIIQSDVQDIHITVMKNKAKGKNSTNAYTVIPYKKIKLNTPTFNQGLLNATQ